VAVSGVYRIPAGKLPVTLGGTSEKAFSLDEVAPLRGEGGWSWRWWLGLPGVPLDINVFRPGFGDDPAVREDASPINHVHRGLPPFLILTAANDLPSLPAMAKEFHHALQEQGCEAEFREFAERNHNSVFFKAIDPCDATAQMMLAFIRRHCRRGGESQGNRE